MLGSDPGSVIVPSTTTFLIPVAGSTLICSLKMLFELAGTVYSGLSVIAYASLVSAFPSNLFFEALPALITIGIGLTLRVAVVSFDSSESAYCSETSLVPSITFHVAIL